MAFVTRPVQEILGQHPGYGFAGVGVSTAIGTRSVPRCAPRRRRRGCSRPVMTRSGRPRTCGSGLFATEAIASIGQSVAHAVSAVEHDVAHIVHQVVHAASPAPPAGRDRTGMCITHHGPLALGYTDNYLYLNASDTQELINILEAPSNFIGTEATAFGGPLARFLGKKIAGWVADSASTVADVASQILLWIGFIIGAAVYRAGPPIADASPITFPTPAPGG